MDLFFVAERQKTHISVDVSEHARGSDIVKVIAGVTGVSFLLSQTLITTIFILD
jgi:hypothetical protein